ncbi:hypothetical protein [Actinomadura montaniterrae]|uniref:Uncharacterized protein n=1 Tax=Actinomadura montaniterrae TaxID=1803903 RepID=A0A6L3VLL3_9ACTN|nr:hypothetical protein [Actinomadura montaniterrae]KAB2362886.1 hypothetical protein F9B16_44175 [Actinomadura montaniterrae]
MNPVRTLAPPAAALVLCLLLPGCSGGGDQRKADCAKITAALRTPSRSDDVQGIIDALRRVRPKLKDDHLAKEVDVVLDVGAKLKKNGGDETGRNLLSDSEAIRFSKATDDITETCGTPSP